MSDALAKLQGSGADMVPKTTIQTCLAQGVLKRGQQLTEELVELEVSAFRPDTDDEPSDKPARKMGQGQDPRGDEIKAELESIKDVMREHTGRVTVEKTITNGDWRLWADEHPAREDGRDPKGRPIISTYDISVTGGFCNGTELLARLGDFVTEWNGEPLADGQWDWLREKMPMGDQKLAARAVVAFYEVEGAKAAPKSQSGSPSTAASSQSSNSPEASEPPASGSSAGNPPSDTSTSTPTGP